MIWIAPSEKDTDTAALEKRLWDAADQFRANSGLKAQEYSAPVTGFRSSCGPEKLHQEFNRLVVPMMRKSQILQRQIQNLRRTRDLLLPRLLSGQVERSSSAGMFAMILLHEHRRPNP